MKTSPNRNRQTQSNNCACDQIERERDRGNGWVSEWWRGRPRDDHAIRCSTVKFLFEFQNRFFFEKLYSPFKLFEHQSIRSWRVNCTLIHLEQNSVIIGDNSNLQYYKLFELVVSIRHSDTSVSFVQRIFKYEVTLVYIIFSLA